MATLTSKGEAVKPASPVRLTAPYAFYDDEGVLNQWAFGQVVKDDAVIKMLVARAAPIELVD